MGPICLLVPVLSRILYCAVKLAAVEEGLVKLSRLAGVAVVSPQNVLPHPKAMPSRTLLLASPVGTSSVLVKLVPSMVLKIGTLLAEALLPDAMIWVPAPDPRTLKSSPQRGV